MLGFFMIYLSQRRVGRVCSAWFEDDGAFQLAFVLIDGPLLAVAA